MLCHLITASSPLRLLTTSSPLRLLATALSPLRRLATVSSLLRLGPIPSVPCCRRARFVSSYSPVVSNTVIEKKLFTMKQRHAFVSLKDIFPILQQQRKRI